MRVIAERIFTAADQTNFAAFSGDANPVHLDEVAARRTVFGAPVVHGMHLLFWALESWFRNRISAPTALAELTASFNRGALLGEPLHVAEVEASAEFSLLIRRGQVDVASIRGRLGPAVTYSQTLPPLVPVECRVVDPVAASKAHGSLPLLYCALTAGRLFPCVSSALPPFQLAALLATTRLVGMECPGLNSVYSGMALAFDHVASGPPEMNFRTSNAESRVAPLRLAVRGPGFQGKLRAFLRPAPCRQATVRELAQLVESGEFAAQRALIIGGSRGLGEVVAKLLAAGGADVIITYRLGKQDAEAVATEISAAGGRCEVARFDVNHPEPIAMPRRPTHLYYFATPHISSDQTCGFSPSRFAEYCRHYVTGFVQTLLQVAEGGGTMQALYPSTIFLDESAQMAEYCAAKAAGEEACRQLARRFPAWRIHAPRLPRMLTDQNNGFLPVQLAAPEIVILGHLRDMETSGRQ